jgi:UDP-glucose 4-epimerase
MMKALVTGGAGFIGSFLVEDLLKKGYQVTVIDNLVSGKKENLNSVLQNINFLEEDIRSSKIEIAFQDIDIVFHLAGLADIVPSITNPFEYLEVNVMGTTRVLEAARKNNVSRVIYAASSSCYGIPDSYPTQESNALSPKYPYALSKLIGEQIFLHWINIYGMSGISLRLFNVYGPRARTNGSYGAVMGVFLGQKMAGLPLTIVGNGEQKRDFIYVTDVVDAFIKAAETSATGISLNIGASRPVSINYLARLISRECEYIPKRPGEPDVTHASIDLAKQVLDWEPQISIETGVLRVLEDFAKWEKAPIWTKEQIQEETKDWFKYLGGNTNI